MPFPLTILTTILSYIQVIHYDIRHSTALPPPKNGPRPRHGGILCHDDGHHDVPDYGNKARTIPGNTHIFI